MLYSHDYRAARQRTGGTWAFKVSTRSNRRLLACTYPFTWYLHKLAADSVKREYQALNHCQPARAAAPSLLTDSQACGGYSNLAFQALYEHKQKMMAYIATCCLESSPSLGI